MSEKVSEKMNDKKQYLKEYHQLKQKTDPIYRKEKNYNATMYYKKKTKTKKIIEPDPWEIWLEEISYKPRLIFETITEPRTISLNKAIYNKN